MRDSRSPAARSCPATIAYENHGRLAPPNGPNGGRNAILCTHGYTGSHHFAGRNPANGNQPGSWGDHRSGQIQAGARAGIGAMLPFLTVDI